MTTTWPRHRSGGEDGIPVQSATVGSGGVGCQYYQHSCDHHFIEEEGRALNCFNPSDTFPRQHGQQPPVQHEYFTSNTIDGSGGIVIAGGGGGYHHQQQQPPALPSKAGHHGGRSKSSSRHYQQDDYYQERSTRRNREHRERDREAKERLREERLREERIREERAREERAREERAREERAREERAREERAREERAREEQRQREERLREEQQRQKEEQRQKEQEKEKDRIAKQEVDCVDCAAAANVPMNSGSGGTSGGGGSGTTGGLPINSSAAANLDRDVEAGYPAPPGANPGGGGGAGGSGNRREGVESGYSTQSREKGGGGGKDGTGAVDGQQQQPYIDSDTQVWTPQVPVQPLEPPSLDAQYTTVHKSPSSRRKNRSMARSVPGTLDRRMDNRDMSLESCDTMDTMPLTPASFAGLDQKDLEERPLTSLTTRMCKATIYDEPPEKSSLFITCSALYAFLLVIICIAFLTSEVVTDNSPLHYYEGFFTFLYLVSIFFLFYVFCYLLHESTCCRSEPEPMAYFQTDTLTKGGMDYCGLQEGGYPHYASRLKKYKTSENEQSHGTFFLRIGGLAFGLGTMVYVGLEFGSWFEIPWDSPCYQAVRGVNPVLQVLFTFSQMYFVFMNARLNIHQFKCLARFGLMHIVATNICVLIRTIFKEGIKDIAAYRVSRGEGVSEDFMIKEGYNILRQRFGNDSFWLHGPYHYIMKAIFQGEGFYRAFSLHPYTAGPPGRGYTSTTRAPPPFNPAYNPVYPGQPGVGPGYDLAGTGAGLYPGQRGGPGSIGSGGYNSLMPHYNMTRAGLPGVHHIGGATDLHGLKEMGQGMMEKFDNFTCGRVDLMGDIVTKSSPFLYPFLIEFSLIGAAVLLIMWARVGKNPRFWGEDDLDRVSVTSRKMITYTRVDCVGASKGLFFGLLLLVSSLICLILFFVLIDHGEAAVSQLAVFLADISHAAIMILSLLAILVGFCRISQMKFHGEPPNVLNDVLLKIGACGVFAYATFGIIAGCLGDYRRLPNLVVMVTGIISIVQVVIQLLFIQDVSRRRIHTADQDRSKPGRQVVTFLLICNLSIWVIYTFEVQKVEESPVQIEFYGYQPWVIIQKLSLPICIFFRFLSTVALAEIWKNSYKTKLID